MDYTSITFGKLLDYIAAIVPTTITCFDVCDYHESLAETGKDGSEIEALMAQYNPRQAEGLHRSRPRPYAAIQPEVSETHSTGGMQGVQKESVDEWQIVDAESSAVVWDIEMELAELGDSQP
jgi:hypothetical protein